MAEVFTRFGDALRDAAFRRLAEWLVSGFLTLALLLLPSVRAWLWSAHSVTAPGFVWVLPVVLMDFTKWLDRTGGSPREVSDRHRIRSILGMAVSR